MKVESGPFQRQDRSAAVLVRSIFHRCEQGWNIYPFFWLGDIAAAEDDRTPVARACAQHDGSRALRWQCQEAPARSRR